MFVTAIIAAGGRGTRFGADRPKQLVELDGQSMLARSVGTFLTHPEISEVVVALPAELMDPPPHYLDRTRLVEGGERRQDSVANAFRAASSNADIVVIHDAARPFVTADLISRTIHAAAAHGAALAAVGAHDTVKQVRQAAPSPVVVETIPRETIYLAQTPQAFRRDVLQAALANGERSGLVATDEAALAERAGHSVYIVEGDASNIKITTADDMTVARIIAERERSGSAPAPARTGRAGTGYDLHRLVEGRPLIIGGVTIPSERGPLGHSDGDVACHAATDAILGAACLGDIGRHFPDTDPQWKGVSSLTLLSRATAMLHDRGFEVGNVDVTVILEKPKIKNHVDAMRKAIADAIGIAIDRVSVKGKTNEGVDAIGRGEAIAAHAVAQIRAVSTEHRSSIERREASGRD